ncbi:unnamed protein product [Schistocephalus solidus]|uniref:Uncharacterized protein n=1 Tax=Schistocephalus solidus TaxID=70667 RepID=A0A183TCU6_SCHSO|nr:unnamed protein product [Schistocephalus solidus]
MNALKGSFYGICFYISSVNEKLLLLLHRTERGITPVFVQYIYRVNCLGGTCKYVQIGPSTSKKLASGEDHVDCSSVLSEATLAFREKTLLWVTCGFFPAATPRATVTTGGLNQAPVSGVVSVSTPGLSDSRTSHLPPLKKSYGGGDSNPVGGPA